MNELVPPFHCEMLRLMTRASRLLLFRGVSWSHLGAPVAHFGDRYSYGPSVSLLRLIGGPTFSSPSRQMLFEPTTASVQTFPMAELLICLFSLAAVVNQSFFSTSTFSVVFGTPFFLFWLDRNSSPPPPKKKTTFGFFGWTAVSWRATK